MPQYRKLIIDQGPGPLCVGPLCVWLTAQGIRCSPKWLGLEQTLRRPARLRAAAERSATARGRTGLLQTAARNTGILL